MKDYSKGKIYTIRCLTDKTLIYVGSTIQSLAKRWGGHKIDSMRSNMLVYKLIDGDWSNWKIELHQLYPCSCIEELKRKEGEIIRLIGTLNTQIAGRTQQEWYEDNPHYQKEYQNNNKDILLEKKKDYYINNKEIINEKKSVKITCECGCLTDKGHLSRHLKTKRHAELMAVQALPQQ